MKENNVVHFMLKIGSLHDVHKNILEIMRIANKVTKKYT